MSRMLLVFLSLVIVFSVSCSGTSEIAMGGDYIIEVNSGSHWLHDFSTFVKTPPQYVLWMEDSSGEYVGTLYITRKTGTEGWVFNSGNRRVESLPVWAHKRNISDDSGILYPSKDQPLYDGITGATPKGNSRIIASPLETHTKFRLFIEINQSTDFNEYWPNDAQSGELNWSGGNDGSGQPSLVYSAWIDPNEMGPWELNLMGHGSSDGSNGLIYDDISNITTALNILDSVKVSVCQ